MRVVLMSHGRKRTMVRAIADQYQVRGLLLMEAMGEVGVSSPEDAAAVWARGLKRRSGAMQYAVMSRALKAQYARQLNEASPNWVTGMSSPWVDGYRITGVTGEGERRRVGLMISTAASTGPAGEYPAVLTVITEEGFWRIEEITADPALYPYTLYTPPQGIPVTG